VTSTLAGVAKCPYSPRHNATYVMTSQGNLYTATVTDLTARDAAIYRMMGDATHLRTAQYNSRWLNGKTTHTHCKGVRISTEILWRVFHILTTEPVLYTFVSVNRRNNEAGAHVATRHEISVDRRMFFIVRRVDGAMKIQSTTSD